MLLVLVLLVVLTTIVTAVSRSTLLETRMTTNFIDNKIAYNAADAATMTALEEVNNNFNLDDFISTAQADGYYDLRRSGGINPNVRNAEDWKALLSLSTLGTAGALKPTESPFTITNSNSNSDIEIKLANNPAYAIGIHDPFYREGTEGVYCMPVSIIGVSSGTANGTLSMIELKTVPQGSCERDIN